MKAIFNYLKSLWNAFTSIPELTPEDREDPDFNQGHNHKH